MAKQKKVAVLHYGDWTSSVNSFVANCQNPLLADIKISSINMDMISRYDHLIEYCLHHGIDGIAGMNDKASLWAAEVAQQLGLIGPSLARVRETQNKYYSRLSQLRAIPDHTPEFCLASTLRKNLGQWKNYPAIVKPLVSRLSLDTYRVENRAQLTQRIRSDKEQIVESVIPGKQYTMDGYIYCGECHFLGVTASEFLPDTLSFSRFEYPCRFDEQAYEAIKFHLGLALIASGLDNLVFNIEFIFDAKTQSMGIVEINTRIASQFIHLIKSVTGISTFEIMVLLALGRDPSKLTEAKGDYALAASCVLRKMDDCRVIRVPDQSNFNEVKRRHPDALCINFARQGALLSDVEQDTDSFRYGWVNVAGGSRGEIDQKRDEIIGLLDYRFDSI